MFRTGSLPSGPVPRSAGFGLARAAAETPAVERGTWFDMCPGRGAKSEKGPFGDTAGGLSLFKRMPLNDRRIRGCRFCARLPHVHGRDSWARARLGGRHSLGMRRSTGHRSRRRRRASSASVAANHRIAVVWRPRRIAILFTDRSRKAGKGELLVVGLASSVGAIFRWASLMRQRQICPVWPRRKREPYLEDTAPTSWKTVQSRLVTP